MSTLTEKLKAKKEAGANSAFWKPNEGDVLEGEVILIGTTITENGDAKYCDIQTETGKLSVFINSVLEKQFAQEGVEEGDTIAIEYLGKVKSKKGKREYKNYVVVKGDSTDSNSTEDA